MEYLKNLYGLKHQNWSGDGSMSKCILKMKSSYIRFNLHFYSLFLLFISLSYYGCQSNGVDHFEIASSNSKNLVKYAKQQISFFYNFLKII